MLRIVTIGNRFVITCMVVGAMVVGSASAALAAPVSSEDELELMGLVEAMPDGGGAGTWIIGGETFTADEDTEIETDEGPLEVGACAEVEYETDADGNLALEIEGEDSPDCIDDEEDEDDADDASEHMGLVESMPEDGGAGTWIIGGETFTADENTEFETDEGLLEVGACAEVEYEAGNLALEIEGEDSPDCIDDEEDEDDADDDMDEDGDDEDDANEADGATDEDGSTSESADGGNATDAGSAEVRLMSNVSGATQNQDPPETGSTETEDPNDTEEEDADEDEADEDEDEDEDADEDEADEDEDENEEDENELFGTIETMPAGSDAPLGTWVIDGVSYVATADTEIEEEYGPFEVGANVELEFEIVDGVNQLTELETEPAPGEAPNTTEGVITSKGGTVVAANFSGSAAADATWMIGNQEYTVLGITAQEGALSVGSMAQVNSYTHADGREIATLIRNVEMPSQNSLMFLPIVLQHG